MGTVALLDAPPLHDRRVICFSGAAADASTPANLPALEYVWLQGMKTGGECCGDPEASGHARHE